MAKMTHVRLISSARTTVLDTEVETEKVGNAGNLMYKGKLYGYSTIRQKPGGFIAEFVEAGPTLDLTPEGGVS